MESLVAKGLAIFLNSSLVDQYFRQFSGHTQVNANDLRSLHYPSVEKLKQLGQHLKIYLPQQSETDQLIQKILFENS